MLLCLRNYYIYIYIYLYVSCTVSHCLPINGWFLQQSIYYTATNSSFLICGCLGPSVHLEHFRKRLCSRKVDCSQNWLNSHRDRNSYTGTKFTSIEYEVLGSMLRSCCGSLGWLSAVVSRDEHIETFLTCCFCFCEDVALVIGAHSALHRLSSRELLLGARQATWQLMAASFCILHWRWLSFWDFAFFKPDSSDKYYCWWLDWPFDDTFLCLALINICNVCDFQMNLKAFKWQVVWSVASVYFAKIDKPQANGQYWQCTDSRKHVLRCWLRRKLALRRDWEAKETLGFQKGLVTRSLRHGKQRGRADCRHHHCNTIGSPLH